MKLGETLSARTREEWRRWLHRNHASVREIWLVYPTKASAKRGIPYNAAVEEALCYGWIDSTRKRIDRERYAQRFTPRRRGSPLSAMNRERVRRLIGAGRMTRAGRDAIGEQLKASRRAPVPADILAALERDARTWANFRRFPASYRRIRIGWVEGARRRPAEFRKRLAYLLKMTARDRQYGMVR